MRRTLFTLALALGLAALVPATALATDANGNHVRYQFFAGMGPAMGPDKAAAPNGSTISLTGTGTFNAGPNQSASGGGTFTIKDSSGKTVASGNWTVTDVLGFVNYGNGAGQGVPQANGGRAKLRITLAGVGDGVLTVTCLLGSPPAGADEGITLILGQGGMNFTHSTGGETVFVPV